MKNYQCNCEYAVFPFGSGMPICIRDMLESKDFQSRKNCIEKGCEHYKPKKEELKKEERSNT